MSTNYLYVAVDESGTVTSDEQFEVAACWYISNKEPRAALNETRLSIQGQLEDTGYLPDGKDEIKGKDLTPEGLDHLFSCLRQTAFKDETILRGRLPFGSTSSPIAYSFTGTDTDLARDVLNGDRQATSVEESIRALLLLSVLNPLLYHGQFRNVDRDRVRVLLDASVWENARSRISNSNKISNFSISFEIWESEKVPGIQFADVAANARFKRHDGKDFQNAHEDLSKLSLQ